LFFETALTLGNIWQHLFDPTAVWQGFINRVDGTLKVFVRGRPSCGFFRPVADCQYGYPY